jgi:hypothetical protein
MFIICIIPQNTNSEDILFDSYMWDVNIYNRQKMIDDLQKKYDITSLNKEEVINLLGTNEASVSNNDIVYTIGKDFSIVCLRIVFDDNGNVVKYYVYRD